MSNAGAIARLRDFGAALRELPKVLGARVAARAAGGISALAKASAAAGRDPDGKAWAPGVDGKPVTLRRTGIMLDLLRYVAIGTRLRCTLGTPYAKYQIGKRHVFPRTGAPLPPAYRDVLVKVAEAEARGALR
jgi:hypothetical protein